jgi:hypothetical protein
MLRVIDEDKSEPDGYLYSASIFAPIELPKSAQRALTVASGQYTMKTVDIHDTNLDACVVDAQSDRAVVMRGGNPVALVVGVQGLDGEQTQLGASDEFWKLISARRKEPTIDRSELERKLGE